MGAAAEKASRYWDDRQTKRLAALAAAESVQVGDFADLEIEPHSAHTEAMSEMTRDELHAHLENQDLKVDARLRDFTQSVADSMKGINHRLDLIEKDISSVKGIKGVVITTAIASTLAIAGVLIGVLGYGASTYDTGRETTLLIQEARQQSIENRQLLEQIRSQQTAPPAASQQ